ncbi:MAG: GDP-L-fucose synthase [Gammaproteobacteria bacterium]
MQKHEKIYVAGHRGLVGSAIVKVLEAKGYSNLLLRTHAELDLTDGLAVEEFFKSEKPSYVFLAAAKVGGIHANNSLPAEFIYQNLQIQTNVIHQAWRNQVKRLLFLGSSCIYPRDCPQPMKEEYLLTGPLEPTNRPYALAKIAGIEMCWAYNRQYQTHFAAVMPTNLYGPNDNYDLNHSHVIPAMIRRMHEAKVNGQSEVHLWGTGEPKREFLYSEDLADACVHVMNLSEDKFADTFLSEKSPPIVNVGWGKDIQIKELAALIAKTVGFQGKLVFNADMPDGTPIKLLDTSKVLEIGWKARCELREGLERTTKIFLKEREGYDQIPN